MNTSGICPECGRPVTPNDLQGLCPECMMGVGLAAETGGEGDGGRRSQSAGSSAPLPLSEVAKHFPQLEILDCLGCGGMGAVYKARQPHLDRLVALKILAHPPGDKPSDGRFAERFEREARALAKLSHPNIVAVYEFGETDGLAYLIMEYVDGLNLRQLERAGRLSAQEALKIVPQICEALQFAHDAGIVHRDIKPENILLDKTGRVKIADFGIAKILGRENRAATLTEGQQVIGTPHYMAPEQVEKPRTVDHRADIYSLGVVFYEMLTGELPLGKFAPPSRMVQVDIRLDEVVLHALEKQPERRYQQVREVRTDVQTIAATPGASAASQQGRALSPPPQVADSSPEKEDSPQVSIPVKPPLPLWVTAARWTARVLGTIFLAAFLVMVLVWGLEPVPSLGAREQLASAAWGLALLGFALGWKFEGTAALLIGFTWALFPAVGGLQPHSYLSPLPFYVVVAALYTTSWWFRHGRRTQIVVVMVAAVLAVLTLSFAFASPRPTRATTDAVQRQLGGEPPASRSARWEQDLDYFGNELATRHKDFFKLVRRDEWEKQVSELKHQVPHLSDEQIVLGLDRVAASLGVAHTSVGGWAGFHTYPLLLFWYSDGLGVFAAASEYREAIGCHVIGIGSMTSEQVEAAVAPYISHENQAWLHSLSPGFICIAELLQSLKVAENDGSVRLSLLKPDGEPVTLHIPPTPAGTPMQWITPWQAFPMPVPLCHKHTEVAYWYEFLPEVHALYIDYRACKNDPKFPFEAFAKEVFAFADSNSVRRVIVDLRNNRGGDSNVVKPLVDGLRARPILSGKGRLYALIGRGTFSSGLLAATRLRNETQAILVGEPTGGKPNCYGNIPSFLLPNSKLEVWYCTKFFREAPQGDPPSLEPDIAVTLSLKEFLTGRDPALETALSL